RKAAKGWQWTVGLVVEAEPDRNFPEARGVVMDLFEGEAREVKVGTATEAQACDFVITAPYSRWKQVATRELDATRGMLQGKLRARVGVYVTDIDEGVTLDFQRGHLVVGPGLGPGRDVTIRADSETVMQLSNVRIGFAGMPNYLDSTGREVVASLLSGRLRIE